MSRLLAVSGHRPANLVPNTDLPVPMDDAWVLARTGIRTRAVADESVVDMATAAAGKACAAAGLEPADVDLVILATCTMPTSMPGGAPQVAHRLGIQAGAFDVNSACAGFSTALQVAANAVDAGGARHVLVVGADRFSGWLDWTAPKTSVLFGDGAGAAVVGAGRGIGPVVWGSDGSGADLIRIDETSHLVAMDGPAVYRWAVRHAAEVARSACAAAGLDVADLAAFVPHQANLRIIRSLATSLGLGPHTVVADDVSEVGNTSAGSIPLALARLLEEGRVPPASPALLVGFGAGLTWAAQVVRTP
ncbi:MAG TPA: beta-ketoacyl-ACP synthase 3 [Mycobacteriales bacterium]